MAGQILSAQINVTAPGAKEAFESVAKSTNDVNNALKQLGQQGVLNAKSVTDAIGKLKIIISETSDPKELQKLNIALSALQAKAGQLPQTFDKLHVSSQKVSTSALNLTKSFGLLPAEASHITHSIESLIESFEAAKVSTGSTTAALGSMAKTIGTGLGIGLAITALSFLIEKLFISDEALKSIEREFDNVTDSIEAMNDGLEDLSNSLDFIKNFKKLLAETSGTQGAALELVDLKEQQKGDQLLKTTIEGDLADINNSIQRALRNAQVIAKSQKIDLAFTSKGLIDKSIVDDAGKITKKYFEIFNSLIAEKNKLNEKLTEVDRNLSITDLKISVEKNKQLEEDEKKRLESYRKYLEELKKQQEFELGLFKGLAEGLKAVHDVFQRDIARDQKLRLGVVLDINKDTLATNFATEQNIGSQLQKRVDQLTKTNPILIRANAKIELTPDQKALQSALDNINKIIADAFNDSLANIGETIGAALSGGDISKAFQQFGQILGAAVQSIGKQLIALGTAALLAKTALKSLFDNPAVEIAAGIALVAVGAALKNLLGGGLQGFAEGGYTGPGGKYQPAGIVHKGEYVIPANAVNRIGLDRLNNLAFGGGIRGYANGGLVTGSGFGGGGSSSHTVVFEIAGQKLRGVLNLTDNSLRRLT